MQDLVRRLSSPSQRRLLSWLQPALQLRLFGLVVLVTAGFALLFGVNSYAAYGRLYEALLAAAPGGFAGEIRDQTAAYLVVSSLIFLAYALALLAVSAAYVDHLIGPTVALQRQVRALQRGDYTARAVLRQGNRAFRGLAGELNGLA